MGEFMKNKYILDATCSGKGMWFDKQHPNTIYVDCREVSDKIIWESKDGKHKAFLNVHPDVVADFRHLPFCDESFYLAVFDPPHLIRLGKSSFLAQKYGTLDVLDWRELIHDGFWEIMRVLKTHGTLIFKWSEVDFKIKEVIDVIGCMPLFGHTTAKSGNTIWMTFMKLPQEGKT